MNAPPLRPPRVLWDIIDEHLAEAAFLWRQRERALGSSDYTFAEVLEDDEARLIAHLEALWLSGERVARRVLKPALGEAEPGLAAAAGHAWLASGEPEALEQLWERLLDTPEARPGLLRALALGQHPLLDQVLLQRLSSAPEELLPSLLEVAALRGTDAGPMLAALASGSDSEPLLRAALRVARTTARPHGEALIQRGLEDARPGVREAAIEAGLIHGLRSAWRACQRLVTSLKAVPRAALLALATGGGPRELELLAQAATIRELQAEVIWALGFSGRRAGADILLEELRKGEAPLRMAEAFAAITGVPMAGLVNVDAAADALEGEEPSEEAEGEEPPPGGALPGPEPRDGAVDVAALERWWRRERVRFGEGRYWHGQPWTADTLVHLLLTGTMRLRPLFAWELAVRTRGGCVLETRGWCRSQLQTLREARSLRLDVTRTYEGFTSS